MVRTEEVAKPSPRPFAVDGDFVGFDGKHLKGRQEIITFHQQFINTHLKVTRLVGKVRSVL